MLKQERIQLIEDYVISKGFASMEDLCKEFNISINTARADVKQLITKGTIQKTYGGVSSIVESKSPALTDINNKNSTIKRLLCSEAAKTVCDGDIVYVDIGETCKYIIDYIPDSFHVTVITNSLPVIQRASQRSNLSILTFGGTYRANTASFKCSYPAMRSYIENCNISKVFLGSFGITNTGALTNTENFGRELRVMLLQRFPRKYLLVESNKFGKAALLTYGNMSDITACYTDENIPEKYRNLFNKIPTELRIVSSN